MDERESQILKLLEKRGKLTNQELSEILGCSTVTIRTCVRNLENQGLLKRTHGGILPLKNNISLSVPAGNIFKDRDSKESIAQHAYQYINDRDTIILDDSSNSYYLAKVIKENADKYLMVITNSLVIAAELAECKSVDLIMVGGMLTGEPPAFMDNLARDMIKNFRATKAFIGVHSIDPEMGITSIATDQMRFKKLIFEVSPEVYVLACSNKFGEGYLLVSATIDKIHRIITDKDIKETYLEKIASKTQIDLV